MTNYNIIAGIIIVIICAVIIGIRVYRNRKSIVDMDSFIDLYGDNIVGALQDVIQVLKIDMASYATKEEYETALISATINAIKENSIELGIPTEVVDLIDTDSLTEIVKKILNNRKVEAFSVLDSDTIKKNETLLDSEVVNVLEAAVEDDIPAENTTNTGTEPEVLTPNEDNEETSTTNTSNE